MYAQPWTMADGTSLNIRPIRPEDEPLMIQFHGFLSEESIYFRYFHLIKLSKRITHDRLVRLCFIDYEREMALVAEYENPDTVVKEIWGVGRLSKLHGVNEAEFSMMIADAYQCRGLGTELLRRMVEIAKDEKLDRVRADILPQNKAMQRVCEKIGFRLHREDSDLVTAEIDC
jgi:acetyltransferase